MKLSTSTETTKTVAKTKEVVKKIVNDDDDKKNMNIEKKKREMKFVEKRKDKRASTIRLLNSLEIYSLTMLT